MKEYHKIQTVFLRSPESKFKDLMEGQWSLPEFEFLKSLEWEWTEKIDGTNIRIMFDGANVTFGGKTDNAQIPAKLVKHLSEIFVSEEMLEVFGKEPTEVCLYGEGFGSGIQNGGNYQSHQSFILFDVKVGEFWLERKNIEDIADRLSIPVVPIIGTGTLLEAVEFVKKGFHSTIFDKKEHIAEGLIMKPKVQLFNRKGERIVAKIKYKDFRKLNSSTSLERSVAENA